MKMKRCLEPVVALILAFAAMPCGAGVIFVAKTSAEGARNATAQDVVVKGWAAGDKAKVVFQESANPMAKQGFYMLTRDSGKTVVMVDPEDKTYYKWDVDSLMGMMGAASKMINITISNPKVELLSQEPGGTIAGMPTTHYRYRTSYTQAMKIMMFKRSARVVKEEDLWATPQLGDLALGIYLRRTPPKTGNEDFDRLMRAEMSKVKGFPLKTRTVMTQTDDKGRAETTTTVMEVTSLETAPVPESTFEIPAGYKETEMMPSGGDGEGKEKPANPFSRLFGKKGG
jgi:Domain of unknown function (DUF4412)